MQVQLSSSAAARLDRPVSGNGGFQQLLRKLQLQRDGGQLVLDDGDLERLQRYSYAYGSGGFQDRTSSTAQLALDFD